MQYIGDAEDLPFMYKIVANNTIMKFNINLNEGFDIDKDEVKFGFNMHIESKRSATQTLEMKIPVVINTGKLKLNTSGGNVSSAQSVASGKPQSREEQQKRQSQLIASGKAGMLDQSFVSAATEKEKLDRSYQGDAQSVASSQQQRSRADQQRAQKAKEDNLNVSYRSQGGANDSLNVSQMNQSQLNASQMSMGQSMNQSMNQSNISLN